MGLPAAIRKDAAAVAIGGAANSPPLTAGGGLRHDPEAVPSPDRASLAYGFQMLIAVALSMAVTVAVPRVLCSNQPNLSLAAELAREVRDSVAVLLPILAATLLSQRWIPGSGRWRVVGLAAAAFAGSLVSSLLLIAIHPPPTPLQHFLDPWLAVSMPCGMFVAIHEAYRRGALAEERARTLRVQDARLEAELSRARLLLLEAQIEPHFLFNTLAHVELLYRTDPGSGARMLDALIEYLQSSLPSLRQSQVLLSEEAGLLTAYLEIHRIRLGPRLSYELSIPEDLRTAEIPSMMLLTLVENAVKHGINPLPQGGRIAVHAAQRGGLLTICVEDSGRGLSAGQGGGFGLANLTGRLAARFGTGARFDLRSDPALGTSARLSLPLSCRPTPELHP
jgi:hypothetical protein